LDEAKEAYKRGEDYIPSEKKPKETKDKSQQSWTFLRIHYIYRKVFVWMLLVARIQ
jgi:hypothetical protein